MCYICTPRPTPKEKATVSVITAALKVWRPRFTLWQRTAGSGDVGKSWGDTHDWTKRPTKPSLEERTPWQNLPPADGHGKTRAYVIGHGLDRLDVAEARLAAWNASAPLGIKRSGTYTGRWVD